MFLAGTFDNVPFVGVGVDADGVRTNFIVRNHLTGSNGEIRVEYHVGCD